jgi:hypothetical protein
MEKNTDTLDLLQNAVIEEANKKNQSGKKEYHFDKLKMYFGEDYEVVPNIKVSMPTIGDILEIGEENFYRSLSPFLYNSTSIRLFLWENNIDWCKVKDIEVFSMLIPTVEKKYLKLLFKDISFDDFELKWLRYNGEEEQKLALFSASQDIVISEDDYMTIAEYIREMLNAHPKVEKAKGKTAKKWMIDEDRMKYANKDDKNTSTLLPLISTCINHPGFKYKLQELKEVGIYQFMDSVQRLQIYESTKALNSGLYSGFADLSKVPKENFNFFREAS